MEGLGHAENCSSYRWLTWYWSRYLPIAGSIGKVPIGRLGEAREVAEGILWLLSDNAGFVAGANIRIAGGRP
jgi:NAD(P)-dependent dehydrogenase (short-subunit alcohol dehydrogenase family)